MPCSKMLFLFDTDKKENVLLEKLEVGGGGGGGGEEGGWCVGEVLEFCKLKDMFILELVFSQHTMIGQG